MLHNVHTSICMSEKRQERDQTKPEMFFLKGEYSESHEQLLDHELLMNQQSRMHILKSRSYARQGLLWSHYRGFEEHSENESDLG